ncbi:PAS domain S-box protein [Capilliphycus salinus ALCB114379]|uniref:PAS domain S-box protein n=1 Tax=Capilliphycus salinus TaxID=2768948 RepID=UPI0039A462B6
MNPSNSDHPVKPQSADAQLSTPCQMNHLNTRTPEALLRLKEAAIEAAIDGIALLENGRYVYLNSQHLRIFGYNDAQELIGQPWLLLYEPSEANRLQQQAIPILESVGHWHGEAIAKRKDGSTFVQEVSLTYTEDQIVICVCRDISDRFQAEQQQADLLKQLTRSNAILQAQMEASDEGFLMIDDDRHVLCYNQKFCQLWQIPPTLMKRGKDPELLRYVLDQLASPKEFIDQVEYVYQHRDLIIEDEIQLKDGRIFERYGAPLRSPSGEYYGRIWSFQDITDRKKIEAELTFFKYMVECSGDAISFADAQGKHAYQNAAFSKLFEAETVEEFNQAGGIPSAFLRPEKAVEIFQTVMRGESWTGELVQRSCRGRLFNSFVRADGLKNNSGDLLGHIAIIRDISDRIAMEEQLRVSQQRLSLLVQQTPLAVIEWNSEFRVTAWNPAAERIFGYTASEAIGRNLEFLVPEFERQQVNHVVAHLLTQHNGSHSINRNLTKENRLIICQWYNTPLVTAEGELVGVASMAIDITEQKRIQSELQRSQAQLQAILDNTPVAIYVKDLEGRYQLINRAVEEIFQVKQADWIGKTDGEVMPGIIAESIQNNDLQVIVQGQPIHLEETVISGGEMRHFLAVKFPLLNEHHQPYALCGISTEITAFKRTEQELKTQTDFLQSIWDNINYGIFVLDVIDDGEDFRFVSFNPAAIRAYSQQLDNFIGQTLKQVCSEEMAKIFLPRYREVVRLGESISFEEKFVSEHDLTWWFLTLAPLKDVEGKVYKIVATSENITERKRTEEKLRMQQTQIKYLLNNIPHMAWLKNKQGQFIAVNEPLSRRLGLTPEKMIGKTDSDLLNAEFARKILRDNLQVLASEKTQRFEKRIVDERGKTSWLEIYKTPILGDKNQTIGVVGIAVEITDRKQTEQYLRQQARREKILNLLTTQIRKSLNFDKILQTTLASVKECLGVDRCGFSLYYPHGEQPYWEVIAEARNQDLPDFQGRIFSASVIARITENALEGEAIKIVNADLEPNRAFRQVLKATKTKSLVSIPLRRSSGQIGLLTCSMHQNKTRNWTDEEVSLLEAVVEQLAIALKQAELYEQTRTKAQQLEQAMEELRRTQAQMIQNEKMSSLGQLVAGVAHEINNPASFIYGNLTHAHDYANDLLKLIELYQTHYPNPHPEIETEIVTIDLDFVIEDLPKLINSMQTGAERIKKIVESLRTFSRLDEAELKTIDLHQSIDSTLMIVESRLYKKPNRPEIGIIKEYGNIPRIECYAGQLNQVFINIFTNAIDALEESILKFIENGESFDYPHIRIHTKLTEDNQVLISISNNGLGIPPEIQQRVFDPFFTTKPVGKGTGMGLSICYQIITEKHGGSIECISQTEQGTEFIIRIPIRQFSTSFNSEQ